MSWPRSSDGSASSSSLRSRWWAAGDEARSPEGREVGRARGVDALRGAGRQGAARARARRDLGRPRREHLGPAARWRLRLCLQCPSRPARRGRDGAGDARAPGPALHRLGRARVGPLHGQGARGPDPGGDRAARPRVRGAGDQAGRGRRHCGATRLQVRVAGGRQACARRLDHRPHDREGRRRGGERTGPGRPLRPARAGAAVRGRDRVRRAVHAPGGARRRPAPSPRGAHRGMRFRRRSSVLPRAPWPNGLERTEPLKGQLWTRSEKALKPPDVHWGLRALAAGVAALETVLLGWLWFGPAFAVRTVEISGAHHLSASQVAAAAGVSGGTVISIDGQTAQGHLLDQVWVRTATVQPELPGTVVIKVSEWEPIAAYHAGPSTRLFLMSSQAIILGPTPAGGGLVDIQGPAGKDPRMGERPLDPQLLTALVNMPRVFPPLLRQDVVGFVSDSFGHLTFIANRRWQLYFGRVLTPEEFATLRDKLTALKAIAGQVNYSSPDLLYVNVMNPAEPAAGFKSRQPTPASPAPSSTPTPNPCR